jgi:hypothetical protein
MTTQPTAGCASGMGHLSHSGRLLAAHPLMWLKVVRIWLTSPRQMKRWYVNFIPGVSENRSVGAK